MVMPVPPSLELAEHEQVADLVLAAERAGRAGGDPGIGATSSWRNQNPTLAEP